MPSTAPARTPTPWSHLTARGTARWAVLVALALGAGALTLGPHAAGGEFPAVRSGRAFPPVSVGDTQIVYGPKRFGTPSGTATHHVERFTLPLRPGQRYILRVENGALDGTGRVGTAELRLNGTTLLTERALRSGAATLAVDASGDNTLEVTVAGPAGAFLTVSALATTDPTYTIYGPQRFNVGSFTTQVTVPASAHGPFFLVLTNGEPNGSGRAKGAIITLNGVEVVHARDVTTSVGSLTRSVTLAATNAVQLKVNGATGAHIYLSFTATDVTPPVITISAPTPNFITRASQLVVTGSVQDQTAVQVAVNGTPATVTGTSFSGTAQLTVEGTNTIHVVATDAAGLTTDSTRTVIRDTQAPVLTVTAPADRLITREASVTVSGTVTDATPVTVNVNGIPLPVDGAGQFTGSVTLSEGANVLTVTATDAAGNQASVVRIVTRDTQAPVLTVTAPADGAVINADHVTVTGTVTDATTVTVTANGTFLPVAADHSFSGDVSLTEGPNSVTVVATDAAGNSTTLSRSVTRQGGNLPPDPATVATPIDPTVATTVYAATGFLYTGPNPIQTGVAPGTIEPQRVVVLRGRVLTRDGDAIPGARITMLGHPEFGQTLSRADGRFDLAVNGGERLTINYAADGFLPAQRQVDAPWQDYVIVEDAALVSLDPRVTAIDFSDPVEVARGNPVTDADGTREATLLFKQGTVATMTRSDGTAQPLEMVHVRATEYTVGPNGPKAMPAKLPSTSAYTYAVELSADEAIAAGARDLRFSQPVPVYVENFLGFPVGGVAPVGYYDRRAGRWVPSDNGRIVGVVGTVNGLVELDLDGDGVAETADQLAAIGIDDAERRQVASLYTTGQSLWRFPVTHFSAWDANWPYLPSDGAEPPDVDQPRTDDPVNDPCHRGGSIIDCQNQVLGERLAIAGTPFSLNYRSNRAPGRIGDRTLRVPLIGSRVPPSLKRIMVSVTVSGNSYQFEFPPEPNQVFEFTWDGVDVWGRFVQGPQPATVDIGYVYPATYAQPATFASAFGSYPVAPRSLVVTLRDKGEIVLVQRHQSYATSIGTWDARGQALGGWTLSSHHAFDPNSRTLHLGTGEDRHASDASLVMSTFAGTGLAGSSGDGGPATKANIRSPTRLTVAPDGSVYFITGGSNDMYIRRVLRDGTITTVAGVGTSGFSPDGTPARQAMLFPQGLGGFGPDGSLYFGDNDRVRRIGPDGILYTVAGTGDFCQIIARSCGDGGPALDARFAGVTDVEVGPDGGIYVVDFSNHAVRRIGADGIIQRVVGTGAQGFGGDGGPATSALLKNPDDLAIAADGTMYIAEFSNQRIRKVTPSGIISTLAGDGQADFKGDGGPATEASFFFPDGVALGPDGAVYVADQANGRIRRITPDGIIATVAGSGTDGAKPDVAPATDVALNDPRGVAVSPDGVIYVGLFFDNRIRRIGPVLPGLGFRNIVVASGDGHEAYEFSPAGRHLRTLDAFTGATRDAFGYDAAGRLVTITDAGGNQTTVERAPDGTARAVVAPFGQRTALTLDATTYLREVTNPATEVTRFSYHGGGLLDTLTNANGEVQRFAYDSKGRLVRDESATGSVSVLARTTSGPTYQVTLTKTLAQTTYRVERLSTGETRASSITKSGQSLVTLRGTGGSVTTTGADGTVRTFVQAAHPLFGMTAPSLRSLTVQTPGGLLTRVTAARRAVLVDPTDPNTPFVLYDTLVINGRRLTTTYDGTARLLTSTTAEGRQVVGRLDMQGRPAMSRLTGFDSVTYTYDAVGRLSRAAQGNRVTGYAYDGDGRLESISDPLVRTTHFAYDRVGRNTSQILPDGRQVRFGYDATGSLTSLTPPGRPAHTFSYFADGLLRSYSAPAVGTDGRVTEYSYNSDRQLARIVRPDGATIDYTYDDAGRRTGVILPGRQVTYGYDPTSGNLSSVATGFGTVSLTYDGSLLTGSVWTGVVTGQVVATYDNNLRVVSNTVDGGNAVDFQYDSDGLLNGAGALAISRDPGNGLVSGTALGAISTEQRYDAFGGLTEHIVRLGDVELLHTTYERDVAGRIVTQGDIVQGVDTRFEYVYDGAGRIQAVKTNGVVTAAYEYDENANRLRVTGPSGVTAGSYDAQDRLLSYGDATYTYNAAGDLKTRTAGPDNTQYEYDALGTLVALTLPTGTRIEYVRDGFNRPVGKRVNGVLVRGFLYQDRMTPIAELDGNNAVRSRFVYGTRGNVPDYMTKLGETYRIITDHVGSVRLVVNVATGDVAQRIDYDEFGQITRNTNPGFQPFGFAGGLYDEDTKLTRFGARDYDAQVGRWTTKDAALFAAGSTNLYEYALGDPVTLHDPTGRRVELNDYVLSNPLVLENLYRLNDEIIKLGCANDEFVLTVTGGDRYIGADGKIYSLTHPDELVANSALDSAHLLERGARAADLGVTGVPDATFDEALRNTDFNPARTDRNYDDGHTHVQLPDLPKFRLGGV